MLTEMIDLISLLALLINFFIFGTPQDTLYKFNFSAELQYDTEFSLSLGFKMDAVLVYYINNPNTTYCGFFTYGAIIINTATLDKCTNTFEHELNHWQQKQALGPFMLVAAYFPCNSNPQDRDGALCATPGNTDKNMLLPKGMNYPLIELKIPLIWDRSK